MSLGSRPRIICILAAFPLLMGACNGTSTNTSGGIPEHVLTIAFPVGLTSLDPSVQFSTEHHLLENVYETLTIWDSSTSKVAPNLATSWDHNADGTVWTFHLRAGVKFQDGTDFNADAVKFSIERELKINKGPAYIWSAVQTIKVVDPQTVMFNLSSPQPLDLISAANWGGLMISPKSDDQPSSWFDEGHGIGTGPYTWQSYVPGQTAVFTRFPGYWGGWQAGQITKILYILTPDATTRQTLLLSGQAQIAQFLGFQQLQSIATDPKFKVFSGNVNGMYYLAFNTSLAPTNNIKVRQALAYSFPQDKVVSLAYGNGQYGQSDHTSLVPNGMWGHTTDLPGYTFDLAKAKSLLAAAGYPNGGFSLSEIYVAAYPQDKQMAEIWKPILAQLGITLNITQVTNAVYNQDCCSTPGHGVNIMTSNWPPTYPSPYDYLWSNFTKGGAGGLGAYWDSPTDNALLAKGLTQSATDQTAAAATFAQVQKDLLDQAVSIPIVDLSMNEAVSSKLDGFTVRTATFWIYGLRTTASG